ncbi:MAG: NifU family protein [Flavobacteriales bacterium]|nr:NifU family protein [Flavobacteriales bacterium]MDW8431629.1 NifU family protein [Flavobacteriales bacterium]
MTEAEKLHCVEAALNSVRPYLARDGGDISVAGLTDDGVLKVNFHGTCKECQLKAMTLSAGLEEALRRFAPFVQRVEEA